MKWAMPWNVAGQARFAFMGTRGPVAQEAGGPHKQGVPAPIFAGRRTPEDGSISSTDVTGRRFRRLRPLTVAAFLFAALAGAHRVAWAQPAPTAPSYAAMSSGLTPGEAAALGQALQIPGDGLMAGGAYQYIDPDRFMVVPTVPVAPTPGAETNEDTSDVTFEGLDLAGIRAMMPPGNLAALIAVNRALRAAGFQLTGGTAHVAKTYFDLFRLGGLRTMRRPIATNVSYSFVTPDRTPLEGPGAAAIFSFDPTGRASLVWLATRRLVRGPDVPILSHDEALAQCAIGALPGSAITADLVHYAPPLYIDVVSIMPHYRCGGTAQDAAGKTARLKTRYIPATLPGEPSGPPTVHVTAAMGGSTVNAQADVVGGTPPYTFLWSSSSTEIPDASFGPSITYDVVTRDPAAAASSETVHVSVIDGNGLTSGGSDSGSVAVPNPVIPLGPDPSNRTTGIEYQSWSVGLTGSEHTADAFFKGTKAAIPAVSNKFYAAEFMSWEIDFRSSLIAGGQDNQWADNVDMVYYSGHGYPGGFTFSSLRDNWWIDAYPSLRLGDGDMEWLALDTCLFLNNDDGKVVTRTKPMFRGLHIVLGFDTTAADSWDLGGIFTDDMFGTATNPYSNSYGAHLTVVQAWALASIITNGEGGRWAAMGPHGDNGVSDVNDRFWGFGAVGPDIRGNDIKGYWRLSGST